MLGLVSATVARMLSARKYLNTHSVHNNLVSHIVQFQSISNFVVKKGAFNLGGLAFLAVYLFTCKYTFCLPLHTVVH